MSSDAFLDECLVKANEAKAIAEKATPNTEPHDTPQWACDVGGFGIANFDHAADRDLFVHARTSNLDLANRITKLVAMVRELNEQLADMRNDAREAADHDEWVSTRDE